MTYPDDTAPLRMEDLAGRPTGNDLERNISGVVDKTVAVDREYIAKLAELRADAYANRDAHVQAMALREFAGEVRGLGK